VRDSTDLDGRGRAGVDAEAELERSQIKQILVVANRTAATPRLLKAIDARAAAGPCRFTLLIPDATDPKEAGWTLETALPVLRRAAKAPVAGVVGGPDPFDSVQDAVREGSFDEIIVSTLPKRTSKWLRRDLITRVRGLGRPVTTVVPGDNVVRDATDYMSAGAVS
jgi:hypothetical protein